MIETNPWQAWRDSMAPMVSGSKLYKGFWVCSVTPYHYCHVQKCDNGSPVPRELDGEFKTQQEVLSLIDQYVSDQEALRKELIAKAKAERIAALEKELKELKDHGTI